MACTSPRHIQTRTASAYPGGWVELQNSSTMTARVSIFPPRTALSATEGPDSGIVGGSPSALGMVSFGAPTG